MAELDINIFLAQYSGLKICYIPNPGNAGDNIIAAATIQLFKRHNIQYWLPDRHRLPLNGEIVFYGGGGNFGKMTNFSATFLQRIVKNVKELVILPHTIKSVSPVLSSFGDNVSIICRERTSFDYVNSIETKANTYLSNDMALSLNIDELKTYELPTAKRCKQVMSYIASKSKLSDKQAPTKGALGQLFIGKARYKSDDSKILNAFRTDGEKTKIALPSDNIDMSEVLSIGVETEDLIMFGASRFIKALDKFDEVNTNRLHVAIASTLLGKKVNFYANNYFKCKAVYDYSLTGFDNLTFID